jgi:hypothetical protein
MELIDRIANKGIPAGVKNSRKQYDYHDLK